MAKSNSDIDPSRWIEEYGDFLYNYAYFRVTSKELAEDLVQETFLAALHSRYNFKGDSKEKTWLVAILKRKIIDYYRKKSASDVSYEENENDPFIKHGANKGQWEPSRVPGVWEEKNIKTSEKEEFYKILDFCLSLLPDKWSSVFRLKTMEEYSSQNVCKELGISSSNFWVIMHRARLRLRECFEKQWFD
jgi:RNA polymerase sigma-70 factor (ECF subfamily)